MEAKSARRVQIFLSDGTQTKGDIIWLGQVAAYGVAQGGAGALVQPVKND